MRFRRWHAFLIWLVGTLTAVALIGDTPYLGLSIAVLSGVVMGMIAWLATPGQK